MRARILPLTLLTLCPALLVADVCAQTFTLSGRVVDKENRPAPGVRVTVQRGALLVGSKVTGGGGDYSITFPAGDPVTVVYSGGGWLPTRVQNLSGRINHSVGKVLSRKTEIASMTQVEADDAAATMKYFEAYPALYASELDEYKNVFLPYRGPKLDKQNQYEVAWVNKKKKLPPGAKGFQNYATRNASDKLATGGATKSHTEEFGVVMQRGSDLYDEGKFREAAEQFARATRIRPDSSSAFYALGSAYELAGQFKEAEAAYRAALALKPDPVRDGPNSPLLARYALANVQAAAGRHAEAVNSYRQLVELLGQDKLSLSRVYFNLALSLDALGRRPEAIEAFKQAAHLDPDYAEAWYNLGIAYSRTEQYGEALEAFKRAVQVRSEYAEAHFNLGLVYYVTDNLAGLAEQLKVLQKLNSPLARELAKYR